MRMLKRTALGLALLLAILLLVPLLFPPSRLQGTLETTLSDALGEPVTIQRLSWGLLPTPHLTIANLAAGGSDGLQLGEAQLQVALRPLLEGEVRITRLHLRDVELPVALVAAVGAGRHEGRGGGVRVTLEQLAADDLTLRLPDDTTLGPWALEAELAPRGGLRALTVTEGEHLTITAVPEEAEPGRYLLRLEAHDWRLPRPEAPLKFETLTLAGSVNRDGLELPQLTGAAYGGRVTGAVELGWRDGWRLSGRLDPEGVRLAPLLSDLGRENLDGRLSGGFAFRSAADKAGGLGAALRVDGPFRIRDGVIRKADLERATRTFTTEGITGGETRFDELSGQLQLRGRDVRLTDLKVTSTALEATGHLRVDPRRNLSGEVEVGLRKAALLTSMPLRVSGTVEEPHLRLTDEALAGAAAGTAVLGPGVGTAVGIKAGKIIRGVGAGVERLLDRKE